MLLAITLGLALHMTVMFTVDNKPLAHAAHGGHIPHCSAVDLYYIPSLSIAAATPNWLQSMLNDVGQRLVALHPLQPHVLLFHSQYWQYVSLPGTTPAAQIEPNLSLSPWPDSLSPHC